MHAACLERKGNRLSITCLRERGGLRVGAGGCKREKKEGEKIRGNRSKGKKVLSEEEERSALSPGT